MLKPLNWRNTLKIKFKNKILLWFGTLAGKTIDYSFNLLFKTTRPRDLTIERVSSFDADEDEFWSEISKTDYITIIKNREYLNWRYANCPSANYNIYIIKRGKSLEGYVILKYTKTGLASVGIIFDILVKSEEIARSLIKYLSEKCREDKIDYLSYQYLGNKNVINALKKQGFLPNNKNNNLWFCAYAPSQKYSKGYLAQPENWLVQLGDSDLI